MRKALATFAGQGDGGRGDQYGEAEPAKPEEELLADLKETITLVREFLGERGASLDDIIEKTGFERNAAIRRAILAAKEAANKNDETRHRFEVLCREVFKKFKACVNIKGVNVYRAERDAINIIYKSLQRDRERAAITDIILQLHRVVDEAIEIQPDRVSDASDAYDISKIDFDRLRKEFERSPAKRTTVQNLKQAIELRLRKMMEQNPLRTDFQRHYEDIVAEYNREKEQVTIERTFEELFRLVGELDEEGTRAAREALDEESLAVFDLLKKPELSGSDIKRIKTVAVELLSTLKEKELHVDHWQEKEATRAAVHNTIYNFLWSDETGLPSDYYSPEDVRERTEEIFRLVYRVYPTVPSPYYSNAAAGRGPEPGPDGSKLQIGCRPMGTAKGSTFSATPTSSTWSYSGVELPDEL